MRELDNGFFAIDSVEDTQVFKPRKGYKAMNIVHNFFRKIYSCRGFEYEEGGVYELDDKNLKLCSSGFHFCSNIREVFIYYKKELRYTAVFEVEALGNVVGYNRKFATDKIKIGRRLTNKEIKELTGW